METFVLTLALLSLGDTPEQTFAEVKKAATAKDWAALYDALSPFDRKELDEDWKTKKERLGSPEGARELKMSAQVLGISEEEIRKMSGRDMMIRMMGKMADLDPAAFDREFGKFKAGAIASQKIEGDVCLLTVKTGEKEEEVELAREGGKWYLSFAPQRRASNQRNASARLKSAVTAQADFRANDRDGDRINNFWVKDVAGLYGIETGGEPIKLIMIEIAQADRSAGRGRYASVKEEKTSAGYSFAVLKGCREGGKSIVYDDGKGRCLARFGLIAYPAPYPQAGRLTYIVNEGNTIYAKDTGGKPVDEFPQDPEKEGWKPID